jgi:hypothetical protein
VLAIVLGRSGKRNTLRARDISGNVVVGNVSGSISQAASPQAAAERKTQPDRVNWGIGIVGVLITAATLAHDMLK